MSLPPGAPVDGVVVPPDPIVASVARAGVMRRLWRDGVARVSLIVIAVIVLASALAPLLTSQNPTASSLGNTLAPIGSAHLLGGDGIGRDVFSELLYGGRTSLIGALICVLVALVLGVPAGVVAGYYQGWFDGVASWFSNILMAVPAIVILLVVLARVGQSTNLAMVVFGVLVAPGVFRLIRASVIAVREELYVDAARVSGLSDARIMRRHILPVVQAPTIIQVSQIIGLAIIIQAGLQFLGLGSQNQASWGEMLSDAYGNIYNKPILLLWPGLAIALTVTAFSLLGNALRDTLGFSSTPARRSKRDARAALAPVVAAAPGGAGATGVPADDDHLLVIDNLRVSYPTPHGESVVVDGVSLTVRRGEVLGLVGESGSGKSQTAFSVLGLLPPSASTTAGRLVFAGQDLTRLSAADMNELRGKRIGYIPQEPMSNLDPSFRIGSQLTEPMRHHLGSSKAQAKKDALSLLERVGITDPARVFRAYPHEISGGMAQRVLIAGAVSCNPDLLIADEPTTALDVTVQAEVLDLIRSLQDERGMGVLLVTHNFGVVADICDRVAVMQSGHIVEAAPAVQLFAHPEDDYTQMLLASTLEESTPRVLVGAGATAAGTSSNAAPSNGARP